jgi:DNA processing protein
MSVGCHRLVRDGALLVTRSDEVLEAVAPIGEHLAGRPDPARGRLTDGLDTPAALVHDALPARGARDTRWLALESGIPIGAVRVALMALERRGLVEHCEGRWRRRVVEVG